MGRFGDRRAKSKRPGSGLPQMRYRTSSVIQKASTRAPTSVRRLGSRRTQPGFSRATGVKASSPWTSWRTFHGFAIPPMQGGNSGFWRLADRAWPRQIVPVAVVEPEGQNVPRAAEPVVVLVGKYLNILKLAPSNLSGMPSATYWAGSGAGRPLTGSSVGGAYGAARRQGH